MADTVVTLNSRLFGSVACRRGRLAMWSAGVFILVFIVGFKLYLYQLAFSLSILAFTSGELIRRLCLFTEEVRHRHSRYGGSWRKVLHASFGFKNLKGFLAFNACAILLLLHATASGEKYQQEPDRQKVVFPIITVVIPLITFFFGLREPTRAEESEMGERNNTHVADGLAWSYYLGYLRFVLPQLANQIHQSESYRDYVTPKLYILMPRSGYCHGLVSEVDPRIQKDGFLPELTVLRGGIPRSFKNTVYKVEIEDFWPQYIALEYATPLMSMWEMSQHVDAQFSSEDREEQVRQFYCKLKEILEGDPQCRDKYELVALTGEEVNLADKLITLVRGPRRDEHIE